RRQDRGRSREGRRQGRHRAGGIARARAAARAGRRARGGRRREDPAPRGRRQGAFRPARRHQEATLAGRPVAEPSTIARPYAEAAFKLADSQGKLADWSAALGNLAAVAADARVRAAVGDPNLSAAKVAGIFLSILSGKLSGEAENFVRVLAENGRLDV